MYQANKAKIFLLFVGDVAALYASLFLMLALRYGGRFPAFVSLHLAPMSLIFLVWLLIFYIAGLYDMRRLRTTYDLLQAFGPGLFTGAALSIAFFYLIPLFGITPKTNLALFIVLFAAIEFAWRAAANRIAATMGTPTAVAFVSESPTTHELTEFLNNNRQLGYRVIPAFSNDSLSSLKDLPQWKRLITSQRIDLLVVPSHFKKDSHFAKVFFGLLQAGVTIQDLPHFYETVFQKVPLTEINEEWFLEHVTRRPPWFEGIKHLIEFSVALALGVALLPFVALIAALIKLTSEGPVIYRQTRVGERGREFTLYKFRTMVALAPDGSAETNGAVWSGTHDDRTTPIGRALRASHLDELPQLWNIILGELSFVGPRPERPEIIRRLTPQVPYYEIRYLIRPGVTGWAQINHRKDATIDDVIQKLQYDIYYLKNRSPILDVAIFLKTIKLLFVSPR
ncbi:MAG: hypothetical protein A2681_00230 [Candidatus Liptonbacteria bacterium RIFCSPHIGHO2_01_FULL_56_18b]|nr:MAG: Sugar transferase [Parcubacteria group bacterium GW2011_GWB1_56_8]OGY98241.1 MAG: hypothetical protein A2681_00230 [Candidatus Liptonbacteria bacterium RIFCSPHIGHO2_01_FULL_56_18b]